MRHHPEIKSFALNLNQEGNGNKSKPDAKMDNNSYFIAFNQESRDYQGMVIL